MTDSVSYPGVYVEEHPSGARAIPGVATSIAAFLGRAPTGPMNEPVAIGGFDEFERQFGGLGASFPMSYAVRDFFVNGGGQALVVRLAAGDGGGLAEADLVGREDEGTGLHALDRADLFNLLCIPPDTRGGDTPSAVYRAAMEYCHRRRAMLLVDPPAAWERAGERAVDEAAAGLDALGLSGVAARNAALYFPRVVQADPPSGGRPDTFVPCGAVAGVIARTDRLHGVWKAPAGVEASLDGLQALAVDLRDHENARLNPLGINCLRSFPGGIGPVVWGARTLRGADRLADEYKYVPVRRLALFLEESIDRGTRWVVFEPNAEPLWAQLRSHVGTFLHDLFRQGAFQAATPREAYFVACDATTTTPDDVASGVVNIRIGFAPSRPAEFVVLEIRQLAGRCEG